MREATVTVRDDGSALGLADVLSVFRAAGLADVEVVSCEGARSVVRATVDRRVDEDRLDTASGVSWWERVASTGANPTYLVELDIENEDAVCGCGDDVVRCETLDVSEQSLTLDVAGPQAAIADAVDAYEAAGATVHLETLRDFGARTRPLDALTDRQREVVRAAFERGYYDVPRTASTTDVAAELELDASTVAEHLQRAERNVFAGLLSQSSSP